MPQTDTPLDRFVQAQNPVYRTVRSELAAGHKQTHWIWFIFPQLRSLGRSETALYYVRPWRAQPAHARATAAR